VTSKARGESRILGSLQSADGTGIVRMEDRFDTDIDDLWSALTNPERLARWLAETEGDLRPGGVFRLRYLASGWEGTGRVEACEPPHRLLVLTKEAGGPDETGRHIEVELSAAGDQTILVLERRGLPLDLLGAFGAGIQVEVEDLAAYVAGRGRCDSDARMDELLPAYQDLAANVS
jgi:uncharacterized protein YndB with AHSA1/START domain